MKQIEGKKWKKEKERREVETEIRIEKETDLLFERFRPLSEKSSPLRSMHVARVSSTDTYVVRDTARERFFRV